MGLTPHTTKHAVWGLLAGPLGHLATNTFGQAAHHKSNMAEMLAHLGLQHGLTDARTNPAALRTVKSLFGAESVVPYELAHSTGKQLIEMPPEVRQVAMQHMRESTHGIEAPIIGPLHKALAHELAGTAPTHQATGPLAHVYSKAVNAMMNVANKPFDTGMQRGVKYMMGGAPLAALAAAEPVATASHVGINAAREGAARSSYGKKFITNMGQLGLAGGEIPEWKQTAAAYLASPAALDAFHAGKGVRAAAPANLHAQLTPENIGKAIPALRDAIRNPPAVDASQLDQLREQASTMGVKLPGF